MRQIIKLTEQDLHRIVKDALNEIINENSMFIDIRHSDKCPNCGIDLYEYIWNPQNILSVSDRFDGYDVDGFQLYRNAYYKCPNCGKDFHVRIRSNNPIFKKYKKIY